MAESAVRIYERVLELGAFGADGAGPGRYWRAPFTAAETSAVERVSEWMREGGLTPRRDAIGNLFGRVEGKNSGEKTVAAGSHLDSVRDGGRFDGPLGVVAALEAVGQLLAERGQPLRPVEVVSFTGEEGSRFPLGLLGSRVAAGLAAPETVRGLVDQDGTPLEAAARDVGLDPDDLASVRRDDLACFLEYHIEQGPILERAGLQLGVVETIVGLYHFHATVYGQADHAGTTPLHMRQDALLVAAEIVLALPELVRPSGGVVTVGQVEVLPGSANVVPGEVSFSIDLRHADGQVLSGLVEAIEAEARRLAAARGLRLAWQVTDATSPVPTDAALRARVQRNADRLGFTSRPMVSGAGHDAMAIASVCPVAMIFSPCLAGRSHRPDEHATPEMIAPGFEVLKATLGELAWG
ncbi:MAG: Zn-dependent hydrolase [Chloroflexi bacterium]|nr:Zn-dependent hydrolase [Chloroflexota bacterium]